MGRIVDAAPRRQQVRAGTYLGAADRLLVSRAVVVRGMADCVIGVVPDGVVVGVPDVVVSDVVVPDVIVGMPDCVIRTVAAQAVT